MDDDRLSEGEVEAEKTGVPFEYPQEWADEIEARIAHDSRAMAAVALGRALALFVRKCHNPVMLAIVIARAAGLTFDEIGDQYMVSRQAAHKALRELRDTDPAFAGLIEDHHAFLAAMAGVEAADLEEMEIHHHTLKGATKWTQRKKRQS